MSNKSIGLVENLGNKLTGLVPAPEDYQPPESIGFFPRIFFAVGGVISEALVIKPKPNESSFESIVKGFERDR